MLNTLCLLNSLAEIVLNCFQFQNGKLCRTAFPSAKKDFQQGGQPERGIKVLVGLQELEGCLQDLEAQNAVPLLRRFHVPKSPNGAHKRKAKKNRLFQDPKDFQSF